ncbi:hypothetical protein Nepgr_010982 [Nepenthes gracilis]|uniref:Uncharacterized protein n=1 Tax=Nepenthes gracilis TaxID=150966 RepID=A0AAD3SDK1_NEPGR|nr:hypothetical protein Nepgr_010982 [Nepenthes gracilis]
MSSPWHRRQSGRCYARIALNLANYIMMLPCHVMLKIAGRNYVGCFVKKAVEAKEFSSYCKQSVTYVLASGGLLMLLVTLIVSSEALFATIESSPGKQF